MEIFSSSSTVNLKVDFNNIQFCKQIINEILTKNKNQFTNKDIQWEWLIKLRRIRIQVNMNLGKQLSEIVNRSLSPDNVDFPKELKFKQTIQKNAIFLDIDSNGNIDTLLNTTDELLAMADSSIKTKLEIDKKW